MRTPATTWYEDAYTVYSMLLIILNFILSNPTAIKNPLTQSYTVWVILVHPRKKSYSLSFSFQQKRKINLIQPRQANVIDDLKI